ncbi:hypothetical protein GS506_02820 [Rhodococcus hoagii]|nr:hypothetical protein [Prescottella equi]
MLALLRLRGLKARPSLREVRRDRARRVFDSEQHRRSMVGLRLTESDIPRNRSPLRWLASTEKVMPLL